MVPVLAPLVGAEIAAAVAEMYAYEGGVGAPLLAPNVEAAVQAFGVQPTPIDTWLAEAF
jgi:hypothetical protein